VTLLDSLLDAIIRLDGEALVMHVGEKPYVVLGSATVSALRGPLSWGQVELSSRPLSGDAMSSILAQMLSDDQRRSLTDLGAIEEEIDVSGDSGGRFIVTAARGGEDVWVEVRRKRATPATSASDVDETAQSDAAFEGAVGAHEIADEIIETISPAESSYSSEEATAASELELGPIEPAPAVDIPEPLSVAVAESDLDERLAALEREAAARLAAKEAELAAAADAALAARLAEIEAEAEASLTERQAALARQVDATVAGKEAALSAEADAALAARLAASES
jgi:hypothetical protein